LIFQREKILRNVCCKSSKNCDTNTALLGLFEAVPGSLGYKLPGRVLGSANSTLWPVNGTLIPAVIDLEILKLIPGY
jgi:hypothetical protein